MLIRIPKTGPRGHQLLEQFLQETDSTFWYYNQCFIFLRNETLENWTVNSLEITMYCQKMLVYIDKSLIGYQARGPAIQYVPNKHHHSFTFKLFCLCGSESGYTYNFSFNEGKQNSRSEIKNFTWHLYKAMATLLGQGKHLFTDNWYTAVPLAKSLLEGTNLTDTVCPNRWIPTSRCEKEVS